MSLGRQRLLFVLCAILVVGVPFLVYQDALDFEFLNYDDDIYITGNPVVQSLHYRHLWAMVSQGYFRSYQPVTLLSHAIDYAIWGAQPRGHHLTNLLLHSANSLMLMGLALLVLRRRSSVWKSAGSAPGASAWWIPIVASATAALLFAVHPLRVESVAWISDRKDLLMTLFLIPSCGAYLLSRTTDRQRGRTLWYVLSVALFLCAVLAKTVAVVLPVALFLLDLLLLLRERWKAESRTMLRSKIPFLMVSLALGLVAIVVGAGHTMSRFVRDLSFLELLLVPAYSLGIYLIRTVMPLELTPVYTAPSLLVLAAVTAAIVPSIVVLVRYRRRPAAQYILLAGTAFLLFVLPTMVGIVAKAGIQPWADRYVYFASVPLFLLLAGGASVLLERRRGRWGRLGAGTATALAVGAVVLSGMLVREFLPVWSSSDHLWRTVIEDSPELSHGYNNLGTVLMGRGEVRAALPYYRIAQDRDPSAPGPWYNMGLAYTQLGVTDSAARCYQAALACDSAFVDAYTALGTLALSSGDAKQAHRYYEAALLQDPSYAKAHHNIGILYYQRGERSEAARHFERAVMSEPFSTRALLSLGVVYSETGQHQKARALFRDAARLGSSEARQLLAAEHAAW